MIQLGSKSFILILLIKILYNTTAASAGDVRFRESSGRSQMEKAQRRVYVEPSSSNVQYELTTSGADI